MLIPGIRKQFKLLKPAFWMGILMATSSWLHSAPPYWGTIFIDPDIITPSDPTTYLNTVDSGRGTRQMFDRRVNNWIQVNAFLFSATYSDSLRIEVQVNPEFGDAATAMVEAKKYAEVVGRLPKALRLDVKTMWIHKGLEPFGGGNNNLLIHTGQADEYVAQGILEETLVHEASHTSLDDRHAAASGWIAAQRADVEFISNYAQDNPTREDIAESFLLYLAVRLRPERISIEDADIIKRTMPNRISYFDSLSLDLLPITLIQQPVFKRISHLSATGKVRMTWSSRPGKTYKVLLSTNLIEWQDQPNIVLSSGVETSTEVEVIGAQRWFRIVE